MLATARPTRRTRHLLTALVAAVAILLVAASTASAGQRSFSAKRVHGKTAVFRVSGVGEATSARLKVGGYRRRISAGSVRRAAGRGKLRVRLPRRVAKRLAHRGASASSRRRWPKLTVRTTSSSGPVPTGTPVSQESLSSFESGNLNEFSGFQIKTGGQLNVTSERAYDGTKSARARWLGGEDAAERVWQHTDWNTGNEVWYGLAVYVPTNTDYCYWNPIRWDNYHTYQGGGDVGGLTVEQNRIKIMRGTYASDHEDFLVDGGELPKGRWVWLELHQVFSNHDGQALSELYVDGAKKGASTKANTFGRKITDLRAGQVNVADQCSTPNAVDFDRVSISNHQRGPIG